MTEDDLLEAPGRTTAPVVAEPLRRGVAIGTFFTVPVRPSGADDAVELTREGDVAILTLNRPEANNGIDLVLASSLLSHGRTLEREGWARAIVLRSNGRVFSSGGDIPTFVERSASSGALAAYVGELAEVMNEAILVLRRMPAPFIVAVDGVAAGAGMGLVLLADLAYGSAKARLVPAYVGLGFAADCGVTWALPRIVGERRATEILLLNKSLGAQAALDEGLLTAVLPEKGAAFDGEVLERAEAIARGPRRAHGIIRTLLHAGRYSTLAEQLTAERDGMAELAATADVAEGLAAHTSRRLPAFHD